MSALSTSPTAAPPPGRLPEEDEGSLFRAVVVLVVIVLLFATLLLLGPKAKAQDTPTSTPATAPDTSAANKAPDARWLAEFDTFTKRNAALAEQQKKIQEEVQKFAEPLQAKLQPEIDYLNGLGRRLVTQIPAGYQFDEKLRQFVPIPKPPTASTPTTPPATPAQPAAPAPAESRR